MSEHTRHGRGGLRDPRFEHDGCGLAFVASISGERSHEIVTQAVTALVNLGHRGAAGCDPDTGDGAGLLIQTPDEFLRRVAAFELPPRGRYGVGMAFLPRDAEERRECETAVTESCADEGVKLLGWREVPVDSGALGRVARESEPIVGQFFVAIPPLEGDALERRLYILRRVIECRVGITLPGREHRFYIASLSSRTIVYKGMMLARQMNAYYQDINEPDLVSSLALVHARFSTNVLPRWDLAHPLRFVAHNGEINTLRGNASWMQARQSKFATPLFGEDITKLRSVIDPTGSDSAQFDNVLELLTMSGRPLEHGMMMMIPEAWHQNQLMDAERKAFYEFHSSLMEPWDGPAAIAFTDGRVIGATLDRNGLRPARYLITTDGLVVMASEAGVLDIAPERVARRWRLEPGRLLLVDVDARRILSDGEAKSRLAGAHPYRDWIREGTVYLDELEDREPAAEPDAGTLRVRQLVFGYTEEDVKLLLTPMAGNAEEPMGSMGNDCPPAVLSDRPLPLFNYFKQLFAQVTNPPIDPIRETAVMSLVTSLGAGGNLLEHGPAQARRLEMPHPILSNADVEKIRHVTQRTFPAATIPATFRREAGAAGLREALDLICELASKAIADGYTIIVLSDRSADAAHVPIPSLLATAAVDQHLVRAHTRTSAGLVVETGEIREVMHAALLIGFGAEAVNPYVALETVHDLGRRGLLPADCDAVEARRRCIRAFTKGLLKTISKLGISTIQSYCGAQLFEAIGIDREVIDAYFGGTPSRIGGIGLEVIAAEALARHDRAFPRVPTGAPVLDIGGDYQWRRGGEFHHWNPETIGTLQHAVKSGEAEFYWRYASLVDDESRQLKTLRGLLSLRRASPPVPLEEVEPAVDIVRRFATGAMSFGSISKEAHETVAVAMNRIGGRSNTGEGGEDPARFEPEENGDWRRSAIKQVASARFGVTNHYLVNADELQIKIAQGAKPGEGGQLPAGKVDETIARLRFSTPGVGLISPAPHHDIYSIEDLAQLIYDLKTVNPSARISVKLVAEVGVGTVATGVSKAHADHIVISGYEGGTGAAPLASVKHAGTPWELGLAEAQQVLVANGLRSRVTLQADGQMKTGRDVVVAALLGAEEFGFSTAPLVAAGCVMMRVCHLNTCPVGIATQDPALRRRFSGQAEHIIRFMFFVAEDVRRHMAALGVRQFDDLVGRPGLLAPRRAIDHWKARGLDLTALLLEPDAAPEETRKTISQDHGIEGAFDHRLIAMAAPALERGAPVELDLRAGNGDRSIGGMLSGEVARRHGPAGLPSDTIRINLEGSAGQSLGAWLAPGVTITLRGEANDYVGKGLSGGRIVVVPHRGSILVPEDNISIGNVTLYGATAGELFVRGVAGERFAVRNSGAIAVVEGVGDHGCEYMTGGTVVVLGRVGRNFAAGMSGGLAFVLSDRDAFLPRCNQDLVEIETVGDDDDIHLLRTLVQRHHDFTNSAVAARLLSAWDRSPGWFVKVIPADYKQVLLERRRRLELVG